MSDVQTEKTFVSNPKANGQTLEEYLGSTGIAESMPLSDSYSKISISTFAIIGIVGLIFPGIVEVVFGGAAAGSLLLISIFILFLALFIVSYFKIRHRNGADAFSYLLIFTAPTAINFIIALTPISGIGIVAALAGLFVAYWILNDREMIG